MCSSRLHLILLILCIVPTASSCGARATAMVQDRSTPVRQPESTYREVVSGDTLYSIAWESGRDYRELAEWNALDPPYVIRPGQKLRLYPPRASGRRGRTHAEHYIVARGDTLYGIARQEGLSYRDLATWNALEPPYLIVPGQSLRLTPPPGVAARAPTAKPGRSARRNLDIEEGRRGPINWRWPTEGAIVARFAPADGLKGIDIAGAEGQEVHAAAGGKVVYRGSGLRGYGQLIIIKHNADFLSAYAHCSAIYVQEGSVIKPGDKIAAMGRSGTDRVKLHFEIRRRGVPIDPLQHLPKK